MTKLTSLLPLIDLAQGLKIRFMVVTTKALATPSLALSWIKSLQNRDINVWSLKKLTTYVTFYGVS